MKFAIMQQVHKRITPMVKSAPLTEDKIKTAARHSTATPKNDEIQEIEEDWIEYSKRSYKEADAKMKTFKIENWIEEGDK